MPATHRQAFLLLSPRERWQALVLAMLAVAGAAAETLGIGAVFPFITLVNDPDAALANPQVRQIVQWAGLSSADRIVLAGATALLALFVVKNLFLALLYYLQARFVCRVEARLASDLLAAYLWAPYLERHARHSSDRIRIVTGEVGRVTAGYLMPLIAIVTEGLVIAGIVALLLAVRPVAALFALLLAGGAGIALHQAFRRRLESYREQRVVANTAMFKWANESLGALKEAKVLGRERHFIDAFAANGARYAQATEVFTTMGLLPRLVVETVAVAALLLIVAAAIVADGSMHEIVPVLTLFGLGAIRVMPSATRVLGAANNLRYYAPAVEAVASDLAGVERLRKYTIPERSAATACPRERLATLELRNVTFRYPSSPDAGLCGINLLIRQGEVIAVVGRSGSGKTTLADLLLGLFDPAEGAILVNGRPVTSLSGAWHGVSALVPQEFFLLDDTVRRNVAFGMPDPAIDDERVWRALDLAQLEKRVRGFPKGLDTPVGERGGALSGGERQRLSIARALYEDADILILDEATSALDPATEAEVTQTLKALRGHKTVVLITHRVSSVAWCDRILVMSAGSIVSEGGFAELAARNPDFAEIMGSAHQAQPGGIR